MLHSKTCTHFKYMRIQRYEYIVYLTDLNKQTAYFVLIIDVFGKSDIF